jgi:acyl-CoA hydrolase
MNNGAKNLFQIFSLRSCRRLPMTTTSTVLRFLADTSTDNPAGRIAAGTVMKWIDEAASVVASQWAKSPCVAASFGKMRFMHGINPGAMVEVEARLAYTGTSSMNIFIEVRSGPQPGEAFQEVTHCVAVFVSPDETGTPRPVDRWSPETPGDVALAQLVRGQVEAARLSH